MKISINWTDRLFTAGVSVILFIVAVVTLYPFLNVIAVSLSGPSALISGRVTFYPIDPGLSAYRYVLKDPNLLNGLKMSIFYVVSGTLSLLILVSLTAYPLSIRGFYGRNAIMFFAAFTMIFNGGLIPTYLVIRGLGLVNTIWAIILPSALTAWYVIVFRTFLNQIPDSMRESAFMDGANDFVILFRIILPLSQAALATIAMFHVVWHWNSFFPALLYLQNRMLHPVQMVLRTVLVSPAAMDQLLARGEEVLILPENIAAAFVVIVSFPIIVVYPFAQKYFTKGLMIGAIKG